MEVWRDVPEEKWEEWQQTFQSSREGITLSAPCPVCNAVALRHWYHAHGLNTTRPGFRARGGLWEWCSECGCYAHYSALVPDWWACDLEVDTQKLTHSPTAIEEALRRAANQEIK